MNATSVAAALPEAATVKRRMILRQHVGGGNTAIQAAVANDDDDDDTEKKPSSVGPCTTWNHRLILSLGWQQRRHWHKERIRWLLVVVVLVLLCCYYVIVPPTYEFWIQRHPQWVFRPGDDTTIAIFFHVYIPPNKGKRGIQEALNIVQEQLSQIGSSSSASNNDGLLDKLSIYFTTTGVEHVAKRQA